MHLQFVHWPHLNRTFIHLRAILSFSLKYADDDDAAAAHREVINS